MQGFKAEIEPRSVSHINPATSHAKYNALPDTENAPKLLRIENPVTSAYCFKIDMENTLAENRALKPTDTGEPSPPLQLSEVEQQILDQYGRLLELQLEISLLQAQETIHDGKNISLRLIYNIVQ
jgi:hypothetical protein